MRNIDKVLGKVSDFIGETEWQLPLGIEYRPSTYKKVSDVECLIE